MDWNFTVRWIMYTLIYAQRLSAGRWQRLIPSPVLMVVLLGLLPQTINARVSSCGIWSHVCLVVVVYQLVYLCRGVQNANVFIRWGTKSL